eukprot:11212847-Lingulodinium_polyedra.AAC.1
MHHQITATQPPNSHQTATKQPLNSYETAAARQCRLRRACVRMRVRLHAPRVGQFSVCARSAGAFDVRAVATAK